MDAASVLSDGLLLPWLNRIAGFDVRSYRLQKLEGDASDRSYFRVHFDNPDRSALSANSAVIMALSKPYQGGELPFMNIGNYLGRCGVRVPLIYGYDDSAGLLFIEDLGDRRLIDAAAGFNRGRTKDYYRQAVASLLKMQKGANEAFAAECVAFKICFDVAKFLWEIDYFLDNHLGALLKEPMAPGDRARFSKLMAELCSELMSQELLFTHRDYHSRNIMLKTSEIAIIDFQDARLGPPQYDLVSLVRDCYVVLPDDFANELIDEYLNGFARLNGQGFEVEDFSRLFDYMTVQRSLKAAGTFAAQKTLKNNDKYLRYIPSALAHAKRALDKRREIVEIKWILGRYTNF